MLKSAARSDSDGKQGEARGDARTTGTAPTDAGGGRGRALRFDRFSLAAADRARSPVIRSARTRRTHLPALEEDDSVHAGVGDGEERVDASVGDNYSCLL